MAKPVTFRRKLSNFGRSAAALIGLELRSSGDASDLINPTSWLSAFFNGAKTKSGACVNHNTALTVTTVLRCVSLRSGALGRLPLGLYQKTAAGREEITDHPLYSIIKTSPDGIRTAFSWRQSMEAWALLRGNGYSRIRRNRFFEIEAIEWMSPVEVENWVTPAGMPYYRYRGEVLRTDDVFHHRNFSLDAGLTGLSTVTLMREQIGLALSTQEHGSRFFSNGASPGVVLVAPLSATAEQLKVIRAEIDKNNVGVGNSNKPFLAYGGLDVKPISLSMADSQFLESRKFDVEEIARAFGVPPHLVGQSEKSTSWGTGIESMNRGFVDWTLSDQLKAFEQECDLQLLTEQERRSGMYFKFNLKALLAGSASERAAFYRTMREIRAININEIRRAEDMNDLPDNIGDNPREDFNTASGKVPAQTTAQTNNPIEDENENP